MVSTVLHKKPVSKAELEPS